MKFVMMGPRKESRSECVKNPKTKKMDKDSSGLFNEGPPLMLKN